MARVIDIIEELEETCRFWVIYCTVYGANGTELYKGIIYNLTYHILKSRVARWDFENYHATIHLA